MHSNAARIKAGKAHAAESGQVIKSIDLGPGNSSDHSFESPPRNIYVGTPGDLQIIDLAGNTSTLPLDRGYHPISPSKIIAAGTTAALLFAIW